MLVIVNEKEKEVTLTQWNGESWSPDFLGDIEVDVSCGQEMSQSEYDGFVDFWETEVENYNKGLPTEMFVDRFYEDGEGNEQDRGAISFNYDQ